MVTHAVCSVCTQILQIGSWCLSPWIEPSSAGTWTLQKLSGWFLDLEGLCMHCPCLRNNLKCWPLLVVITQFGSGMFTVGTLVYIFMFFLLSAYARENMTPSQQQETKIAALDALL